MDILKRIQNLCREKGTNPSKLEKELGFGRGTLYKWNKSIPSTDNLSKVAEYFNVSVDYLIGKQDNNFGKKTVNIREGFRDINALGQIVNLSILSSVKAGWGSAAVEEYEGTESLPRSFLDGYNPEECFVLRVKGDSMYPRFLDGDRVLVFRTTSVDSGSIAIVLFNGDEATLKKVRYTSGEDWLELIPFNPEYQIKRIEGSDLEQCMILGKVIKLIRDV